VADNFEDECTIDIAAALATIFPAQLAPGYFNNSYQPPNINPPQFAIDFNYNGTWYDFSPHYVPGSASGIDRPGFEVSTHQHKLWDAGKILSGMRFVPVKRMKVRTMNANRTNTFFKGFVQKCDPEILLQRPDKTDHKCWTVHCVDETEAFRRCPVDEVYENVTESFMIAALIERYCGDIFDVSGIDVTLGAVIPKRTIKGQTLSQFIDEVLRLNQWTMWLDIVPDKTKIYLQDKGHSSTKLPIVVNDTTVWQYFTPHQFKIGVSDTAYRNRVIFPYNKMYNQGSINVAQGETIVYGFGTDWFDKIFPGNQFRLPGSESTYTVSKNNTSVDGLVQEIWINEFQEDTVTGSAYEMFLGQDEIVVDNVIVQEGLKTILGETGEHAGVRAYVATLDQNWFTEDEAEQLANAILTMAIYEGDGETDNRKFPFANLRSGQTMRVTRQEYQVDDDIVLQSIDWRDGQGHCPPRSDGRIDPLLLYRISLTDRLISLDNQLRAMMLQARRVRIKDKTKIKVRKNIDDFALFKDCLSVSEGSMVADDVALFSDDVGLEGSAETTPSELELSDEITSTLAPPGPWYWGPVTGGHAQLVWIGMDSFSRWS
jgi:hypothetical protein